MATLSTHTLNSIDGTHAGDVAVCLARLDAQGRRVVLLDRRTDAGGRLTERIDPARIDVEADHELVFQTGAYFAARGLHLPGLRLQHEVVIRFRMPDAQAAYHLPLVMAPNGYSVWLSS